MLSIISQPQELIVSTSPYEAVILKPDVTLKMSISFARWQQNKPVNHMAAVSGGGVSQDAEEMWWRCCRDTAVTAQRRLFFPLRKILITLYNQLIYSHTNFFSNWPYSTVVDIYVALITWCELDLKTWVTALVVTVLLIYKVNQC